MGGNGSKQDGGQRAIDEAAVEALEKEAAQTRSENGGTTPKSPSQIEETVKKLVRN